jgi:hypothetical protein
VAIKEKLMRGEVIYNIHRELFRLIEDDGIAVKDACAQLRVSPYMYRKYKKIKETSGWEGIKEELYEADYIEKKHLSIEVKTKLYEVIRKNPKFGAKKISDMLDTEEFGFTKVDERRIYDELKRANLSTRAKREIFVERGGKKRIKLPGTPLLTMDGEVILDFESSEAAIPVESDTAGIQRPVQRMSIEPSQGKIITMRQHEQKVEKKLPESQKAVEEPIREKTPVDAPAHSVKKDVAKPKVKSDEKLLTYDQFKALEKEKEKSSVKKETKPKKRITKKKTIVATEFKIDEVKKEIPARDIKQEKIELSFNIESAPIDTEKLDEFYKTIRDDLEVIHQTTKKWPENNSILKKDLKKLLLTIAIVIRNPYLKDLGLIYNVFDQVLKGIELLAKYADNFEDDEIVQNANEILKYIEKENILTTLDRLYEMINELGVKQSQLKMKAMKPGRKRASELDMVRKKIAQKQLLKMHDG